MLTARARLAWAVKGETGKTEVKLQSLKNTRNADVIAAGHQMKLEPRFTHDCEGCTFLGTTDTADLYFCTQEMSAGKPLKTVIARFSSESADYISGIVFAKSNKELAEAKRLAEQRGLI